MRVVSSHAIKFGAGNEAHGNAISSGFFHNELQAQIVAVFGYSNPFKRTTANLERLSDGIDAVDEMHVKSQCNAGRNNSQKPQTICHSEERTRRGICIWRRPGRQPAMLD